MAPALAGSSGGAVAARGTGARGRRSHSWVGHFGGCTEVAMLAGASRRQRAPLELNHVLEDEAIEGAGAATTGTARRQAYSA